MRTVRQAAPGVAASIRSSISAPVAGLLLAAFALPAAPHAAAQPAVPALDQPLGPTGQQPTLPTTRPPARIEQSAVSLPYDSALAEYRAGNLEPALAIVDRALQVDARDIRLRFLRGVILTESGRAEAAIEVFEAMTRDFPELPEPYNNLAVLHAARGELEAAQRALQDAVRAVPSYALAHENLGDLHLRFAARSYEQARRLDPGNTSAASKLGLATELIGRVQPPARSAQPR
jgi:tetratricopeptide (TPR) repeat protein